MHSQFKIDPIKSTPQHLKQWMTHLKKTGVSNSRLIHHKSALTGFFSFLIKMNIIDNNPAEPLFPIRKQKVISTSRLIRTLPLSCSKPWIVPPGSVSGTL